MMSSFNAGSSASPASSFTSSSAVAVSPGASEGKLALPSTSSATPGSGCSARTRTRPAAASPRFIDLDAKLDEIRRGAGEDLHAVREVRPLAVGDDEMKGPEPRADAGFVRHHHVQGQTRELEIGG